MALVSVLCWLALWPEICWARSPTLCARARTHTPSPLPLFLPLFCCSLARASLSSPGLLQSHHLPALVWHQVFPCYTGLVMAAGDRKRDFYKVREIGYSFKPSFLNCNRRWQSTASLPSRCGSWDAGSNSLQATQGQLNECVTWGPRREHLGGPEDRFYGVYIHQCYNVTNDPGHSDSTRVLVLHPLFPLPHQWLLKLWMCCTIIWVLPIRQSGQAVEL